MIQAIIFDFYGVLSSDDMWDFVGADKNRHNKPHELADKVNLGEIDWNEYCTELAQASGRTTQEISTMYASYQINRALIGYIRKLKPHYKIGMITNANHEHIDRILNEIGAGDLFDCVVVSADVQALKPQPAIYKEALRQLGVAAEACVFTDDAIANVAGAQAVGMRGLLFEDVTQFRNELEVLLAE